jgi:monoamine oxidase
MTVLLGVLRECAIAFDPPLPDAKLGAIDNLRMGVLDKVYLRFPEVFWDVDADVIGFMPSQRGEWVTWLNFARHTDEPILAAFNAGSVARRLEQRSAEELVAKALDVLCEIYA